VTAVTTSPTLGDIVTVCKQGVCCVCVCVRVCVCVCVCVAVVELNLLMWTFMKYH